MLSGRIKSNQLRGRVDLRFGKPQLELALGVLVAVGEFAFHKAGEPPRNGQPDSDRSNETGFWLSSLDKARGGRL